MQKKITSQRPIYFFLIACILVGIVLIATNKDIFFMPKKSEIPQITTQKVNIFLKNPLPPGSELLHSYTESGIDTLYLLKVSVPTEDVFPWITGLQETSSAKGFTETTDILPKKSVSWWPTLSSEAPEEIIFSNYDVNRHYTILKKDTGSHTILYISVHSN